MQYAKYFIDLLSKRWLQHIAFWSFFIFLESLGFRNDSNTWEHFANAVFRFLTAGMLVYLNLFVFIPKLLEKQKTDLYLIVIISSYLGIVLISYNTHKFFLSDIDFMKIPENRRNHLIPALFGFTFLMTILSSMIHFTKRWVILKDVELELKEEKSQRLEAELKTLKAQINPHFLFNSLNNIYSLSLDKSNLAPDMILKLSDLMSYIIYDARAETVPLKMELDFVKNHVDLEKIRVKNRVEVSFEAEDSLNHFEIAPLLFTPFIENAFKYVAHHKNTKAYIDFKFIKNGDYLVFIAKNSAEAELTTFEHENHGIGIENVKKRLQLIYPKHHNLIIEHRENSFEVKIEIFVGK